MRYWKPCVLAIPMLLIFVGAPQRGLAVSASDVVNRPCNVNVTDAQIEDLIQALFEGTGVDVRIGCSLRGTVSMTSRGDQAISEVLHYLLCESGDYCWYTLGCRLVVRPRVERKRVTRGRGYIRNITTGCVTLLVTS